MKPHPTARLAFCRVLSEHQDPSAPEAIDAALTAALAVCAAEAVCEFVEGQRAAPRPVPWRPSRPDGLTYRLAAPVRPVDASGAPPTDREVARPGEALQRGLGLSDAERADALARLRVARLSGAAGPSVERCVAAEVALSGPAGSDAYQWRDEDGEV